MTPARLLYWLKFKGYCSGRGGGRQKPHPLGKDPETSGFVEGQGTGVARSCSPQAERQRKSSLRLQAERVESRQDTFSALGPGLFSSGADSAAAAPRATPSARRGVRKAGWAWPREIYNVSAKRRRPVSGRGAASDFLTLLSGRWACLSSFPPD